MYVLIISIYYTCLFARTTVQTFTLISLAEEYSRMLSSFEVNEDDW